MINRDSRSYPFLAIAQYHEIDYGIVLAYADAARKIIHGSQNLGEFEELDVWECASIRHVGLFSHRIIGASVTSSSALGCEIIAAVELMLDEKGETR